MDGFLARALKKMNEYSASQLRELEQSFKRSMQINNRLFDKHAFRRSILGDDNGDRSVINMALFDVCSVLIGRLEPAVVEDVRDELRIVVKDLLQDEGFIQAINRSTNSRKAVCARFRLMEEADSEVIA